MRAGSAANPSVVTDMIESAFWHGFRLGYIQAHVLLALLLLAYFCAR